MRDGCVLPSSFPGLILSASISSFCSKIRILPPLKMTPSKQQIKMLIPSVVSWYFHASHRPRKGPKMGQPLFYKVTHCDVPNLLFVTWAFWRSGLSFIYATYVNNIYTWTLLRILNKIMFANATGMYHKHLIMSSFCPDAPQPPHIASNSFLNGCLSCRSWPLHFMIVTPCLSKHLYTQRFTICKRLLSPFSYFESLHPRDAGKIIFHSARDKGTEAQRWDSRLPSLPWGQTPSTFSFCKLGRWVLTEGRSF